MRRGTALAIVVALLTIGCGGGHGNTPDVDGLADLQRQIDSLPQPAGADPMVWGQLKGSLSGVLRDYDAARAVSGPPLSSLSRVTDLKLAELPGGALSFSWSYLNLGDYDQNSEVGVSDLTPIGVHYQVTSVDPTWPAARVADGDLNGEVGVSDITPIGANFQNVVTGYQLQASATPTDEPSWTEVDEIPFSAGVEPAEGGPLEFSFELADPQTSYVYRVAPYYSDGASVETGIASNQRTYGSSPEVEQLLADAQEALLNGIGTTAKAKYEQVQELAPDNPTAGFGLAFIAIMHEANDVVDFLSEYNDPLFRNVALVPVESLLAPVVRGRLWDVLSRVTVPKNSSEIRLRDMSYEEIRTEIIAVIEVLTYITDQLDIALESMPDDWSLDVPEDWNSPLVGVITITKPDALTLSAVLDMAVGVLHFSIAYSGGSLGISESEETGHIEITGLSGDFVYPEDLNEDGLIDMQEAFSGQPLPAGAAVLNSDGRLRLTSFTTYTHRALTKAVDATELYLDQGSLIGHWAYDMSPDELDEFEQDWDSYGSDYAADLVALWSTGATLAIRPALLAAYPDLGDDPGADFSLAVNFAEFFSSFPEDLRDFPIRFGYTDEGDRMDYFMPPTVGEAFSDPTVLGLFPDGLTQEQYQLIFIDYVGES